jgi:hypothetical protein
MLRYGDLRVEGRKFTPKFRPFKRALPISEHFLTTSKELEQAHKSKNPSAMAGVFSVVVPDT